ncbi:MAG: nitroreductase, partial [Lachnospiraceae bacterium]|nr:nitroreductase [Lachnospiraceae bacterium]
PAEKMSLRETLMRKGVGADSRIDFTKLFFDGALETPMLPENAGDLFLPLEMVRLAPSAVNRQPWRAVRCGNLVHFYEKKNRGMATGTWDVQKIDMGIALCHFELGAAESGLRTEFVMEDPGLTDDPGCVYTASFRIG